jgi:glycosyltransferase involved in cell wall biosynthesis
MAEGFRVARTIESFYPYVSGPANQAFQISKRLGERGIDSPVFTTGYGAAGSPESENYQGVAVNRLPSSYSLMRYLWTPALKKTLLQGSFDLFHSHNYRNYQADVACRVAAESHRPFILSVHGSLLGYRNFVHGINSLPYRFYDFATGRKTVLSADCVVVSSKSEIAEAEEFGVDPAKIRQIPMGIDTDDYAVNRKDTDSPTALFVGRLSRNRNVEPIIRAMAKADPRIRLRIVGDEVQSSSTSAPGYVDELKRLTAELGLSQVTFVGAKYGTDLIKEYQAADMFVYTSLSENFGQSMLEAAAAGLPLICTPVGIAPELIRGPHIGSLVDFHDPTAIAEAMGYFLDYKKRQRAYTALRAVVHKEFAWDAIINSYERLYLEVR